MAVQARWPDWVRTMTDAYDLWICHDMSWYVMICYVRVYMLWYVRMFPRPPPIFSDLSSPGVSRLMLITFQIWEGAMGDNNRPDRDLPKHCQRQQWLAEVHYLSVNFTEPPCKWVDRWRSLKSIGITACNRLLQTFLSRPEGILGVMIVNGFCVSFDIGSSARVWHVLAAYNQIYYDLISYDFIF